MPRKRRIKCTRQTNVAATAPWDERWSRLHTFLWDEQMIGLVVAMVTSWRRRLCTICPANCTHTSRASKSMKRNINRNVSSLSQGNMVSMVLNVCAMHTSLPINQTTAIGTTYGLMWIVCMPLVFMLIFSNRYLCLHFLALTNAPALGYSKTCSIITECHQTTNQFLFAVTVSVRLELFFGRSFQFSDIVAKRPFNKCLPSFQSHCKKVTGKDVVFHKSHINYNILASFSKRWTNSHKSKEFNCFQTKFFSFLFLFSGSQWFFRHDSNSNVEDEWILNAILIDSYSISD